MKNYQVTVGFKAVIQIDVKSDSEKEAKEYAMMLMKRATDKMQSRNLQVVDSNYAAHGIVDNTESWDMVQS